MLGIWLWTVRWEEGSESLTTMTGRLLARMRRCAFCGAVVVTAFVELAVIVVLVAVEERGGSWASAASASVADMRGVASGRAGPSGALTVLVVTPMVVTVFALVFGSSSGLTLPGERSPSLLLGDGEPLWFGDTSASPSVGAEAGAVVMAREQESQVGDDAVLVASCSCPCCTLLSGTRHGWKTERRAGHGGEQNAVFIAHERVRAGLVAQEKSPSSSAS